MGNSTQLLDIISSSQSQKEVTANALFDAASPATLFGRRASTTSALTWGYYGGTLGIAGALTSVANGTVTLTASSTNYVESTIAGVVSCNTSGFTSGRIALYTVVTGASSVTSYTDSRAFLFSAMTEQMVLLNTAYTLTSQTAAQKLFNASTNGALTLAVGSYDFECAFALSSMSSSSGTFGFAFGGTATMTQTLNASAIKAASLTTAGAWQVSYNTAANTALTDANTATNASAVIRGRLNITAAGTVIPQVSLGVAAAAVVATGAYFEIGFIGNASGATNILVGNWS
jgi:hypothetical protein